MAPISNASRLAEFGSGIGTDGAVIQVDNTNKRVGIATTNPQSTLQVGTGVSVYGNVGIVSATEVRADTLRGDGTNITGVVGVGTLNVRTETVTTSGVSTFAGVTKVTDTTETTSTSTGAVIISGGVGIAKSLRVGTELHVGGDVSIGGTLTYEDVTNIDSVGLVTARAGVNVSGGQFLVGSGVTIGNAGVATFSGTSDVHLLDNVRLNIGDGSDLRLYHNGSHSFIDDQGTGNLIVRSDELRLRNTANDETYLKADNGSSVDIYYNGSKKWETTNDGTVTTGIATATGVDVTSNLIVGSGITMGSAGVATFSGTSDVHLLDNVQLNVGDSSDLSIYHNGTHSYIDDSGTGSLYLKSNQFMAIGANGETMIQATEDAGVYLRYNNGVKFETTNDGTTTTGVSTSSLGFNLPDGAAAAGYASIDVGSSGDFQIWHHSNNHTYFVNNNSSGQLIIGSNETKIMNEAVNETCAVFNENGNVELYYDNSKKWETTKGGTITSGIATATRSYVNTPSQREDDNIPLLVKGIVREDPVIGIQGKSSNGVTLLADAYLDGESQMTLGLHYSGSGLVLGQVGVSTDTNNAYVSIQDAYAHRPGAMVIDDGAIKFRNDSADGIRPVGTAVTMYDRMTIENSGRVLIGDGSTYSASGNLHVVGDNNSNGPELYLQVNNNNTTDNIGALWYGNNGDKSLNKIAGHTKLASNTSYLTFHTSKAGTLGQRFEINNDGVVVTGIATCTSVEDSKGDLRSIPASGKSSQYTLAASDAGTVVYNSSGGWIIPNNTFDAGDTVSLLNNSGSNQTITASALGTALYNTADGANIKSSTINLEARAMATVYFISGTIAYLQASKIAVS